MATLVVVVGIGIVLVAFGALIGAFLVFSFAIRREDERRLLSFGASSSSERVARAFVGASYLD